MLPLKDIIIGKADAINYYKSGDKDFQRRIYFLDDRFKEIFKSKSNLHLSMAEVNNQVEKCLVGLCNQGKRPSAEEPLGCYARWTDSPRTLK